MESEAEVRSQGAEQGIVMEVAFPNSAILDVKVVCSKFFLV